MLSEEIESLKELQSNSQHPNNPNSTPQKIHQNGTNKKISIKFLLKVQLKRNF
jgi:hypothetical protein